VNFLDDFDSAAVIARHFNPIHVAPLDEEFQDQRDHTIGLVKEDFFMVRQSSPDVLVQPQTERPLDVTAFEFPPESFKGRNLQPLVDAEDPLGIESGMAQDLRHFRCDKRLHLLELSHCTRLHDFANGGADGRADTVKPRKVFLILNHLEDRFSQRANRLCGPAIRLHPERIRPLPGKKVRESEQFVGYFRIGDEVLRLRVPHALFLMHGKAQKGGKEC
jgi:hypothetical protein